MSILHRFIALSVVTLCLASSQENAHAAAAPVIILTPAGGEVYVVGSKQRVRLDTKTRAKSVAIELSIDGGGTFTALGTINNAVKDRTKRNVLEFTVPNTPSGNCMVRATAGVLSSVTPAFSIGSAVGAAPVTATQISSDTAAVGGVLTADGSGGASFTTLDGKFVKVAGDTMTGALTLSGDPTASLQAATKQYVDAADATLTSDKVSKAGDTMTGALTVANKVTVSDVTTATMTLSGGATDTHSLISDANGLRLERAVPGTTRTFMNLTGSNNDFSFGFGGRLIARGNGSVAIDGAFSLEATTLTGNFTANNATCVFFCNTAASAITVTLPDPSTAGSGRFYIIKKISANFTVTIDPPGATTIDGAANVVLTANNEFRILMSSGSNWFVISQ